MASSALAEKFKDKPSLKFGDEGEPDMESPPRGGGAGVDDGNISSDDTGDDDSQGSSSAPPDDGNGEDKAAEDLADMLGVGAEDRPAFTAALQAYVQAQIAQAMSGTPGAGPGEPDSDDTSGAALMQGSPGPGAGAEMGS